ncbi:MAG: hypothetical protein EBR28_13590, partial [Planctomycetia bacterium]|nr:hypothetical protein [Planctomycetia bacterium]
YAGGTTLTGGTLAIGDNNALGTGTVAFNGGALSSNSTAARAIANAITFTGSGTLGDATNNGTLSLSGAVDLGGAVRTLNVLASTTVSSGISNGGLIKIGSGALALTAANTMTGTTQFNAGSVAFSGGLSPGYFSIGEAAADSGVMTMTGGTLSPSGFFRIGSSGTGTLTQSGGLITFTAAQQLPSLGRFANSVGVLTVSSGTFQLTGNPATAQAMQVGAGGTGTLNISGNGVVDTGTAAVGNGLLVVGQNAGTGAGTVNLDGGTLRTGRIATTGSAAATSTFNFNGGTVVALTSNATFMQGLTNAYVKSGGAVIDTSGRDITIAQNLLDGTGGGGLTKTGSGTLTISGSNTYTGTTTISGGMLAANNANALGTAGSITLAGGTLQYTAASAGQDWASRFKGSTSAISLDTNGQSVTLAGPIDSTNTAGLTKLGAGTLALTGTSGYRGDTTVSAGTLLLSGNGAVTTGTAGMLYVGRNAGDSGSIVVQGGASLSVGQVYVGNAAASSGTVTITGGTLLAANDGSFLCRIGASGSATWNQSGGLVIMQDLQPTLGRLTGGRGEMTVSSGTFLVTGTSANALMNVGSQGVGVLTISGNGVVETGTGLSGGLNVVNGVAGNTTGSGLVNLDGGTLRTRVIATGGTGSAVSTFNFNGGALVALASSPGFMQGLTAANVKAGGARIDTNGNDITIAQALLNGGGGGGLTKNGAGALTLAGTSTYTG